MKTATTLCGLFWAIAAVALAPTLARGEGGDGVSLDLRRATGHDAEVRPSDAAPGAVAVTFKVARWPGVTLKEPTPSDWRPFGFLVLDVTNPGPRAVELGVRVDDSPEADGNRHCRTGRATFGPGAADRVAVDLGDAPMSLGMRGRPGPPGYRAVAATGEGPFDPGHVLAVTLFLSQPAQPSSLVLRGARLLPRIELKGVVDRFGQYAGADWPGKLHDEAELARRRLAEEADLAGHPAPPDRDAYGGWAAGPLRKATGFFRVERVDGVWWFVDPEGRLFLSTGIDSIRPEAATLITGREPFFRDLPAAPDPMAKFFGRSGKILRGPVTEGRTYDFYRANLLRKYGPDFEPAWRETTLRRLPSWGFNTIANWSERALYRNGRVAYVATAGTDGDHARVSSGSDYWGKMHDPFDPKFARDVARNLRSVAEVVRGDPWCLGYFVDNELSWGGPGGDAGHYGLALGALRAGADSPAHTALVARLRERHRTPDRLNAAWGTSFSDWSDLDRTDFAPAPPFPEGMRADLSAFVKAYALRYFQTVRDALKQVDPDHLFFGCRFAWRTPEAVEAAAEVCDVVSFNIYQRRIEPSDWSFLGELGKPVIIGEFHVGALDRGMFHTGLVSAADQDERAAVFRSYVESVVDNPSLIGCHWFQYADQPLTGRVLDGENYNIGFMTVTDTPYPEMVESARTIHRTMYARRSAAGHPSGASRNGH